MGQSWKAIGKWPVVHDDVDDDDDHDDSITYVYVYTKLNSTTFPKSSSTIYHP